MPRALRLAVFLQLMRLPVSWMKRASGSRTNSEGQTLDPQARFMLWLYALTMRPLHELSAPAQRTEVDATWNLSGGRPVPCAIEDRTLDLGGRTVKARIYRPLGAGASLPVLVYFHGGGFSIGSIRSHDPFCRLLANEASCIVVAVEYRLGPEHKFPAAHDDALDSFAWVARHAAELGGDAERIGVGGDSAGANLATNVARLARQRTGASPIFQLLIYPTVDATKGWPSSEEFKDGYFLTAEHIRWFFAQYIDDADERFDPRASPLLANDLASMPPAHLVTAGFDPLRDEGRAYAARLRDVGVQVTHVEYGTLPHMFVSLTGVVDAAHTAVVECAAAVKRGLARAPVQAIASAV
jgi:acetyl esterase